MACCLKAPSHYLNQCWLMISEVLWHSPDSNFTENRYLAVKWVWNLLIWDCSQIPQGPMNWYHLSHMAFNWSQIIQSLNITNMPSNFLFCFFPLYYFRVPINPPTKTTHLYHNNFTHALFVNNTNKTNTAYKFQTSTSSLLLLFLFNTSPLGPFGRKIADYIFKCIFFSEKDWISVEISLQFVPRGSTDQ